MIPAVGIEGFSCCLRVLIIAEHDHRTLNAYLADTVFVGINDFCLNIWNRLTDGIVFVILIAVANNDRRTFRQTVALEGLYTEAVHVLYNLGVNSCRTGDNKSYRAAEGFFYLAEEKA